MAASLALSDRTVNARSAPSTPSTTPAASLINLPDGPETPLAAASCRSACFASLELLDHAPPAAIVECENATPASPVLGSWELDRPVRPPHVNTWSELTPPQCAPAPAAPSRSATPLVATKPRAAKPRAGSRPAKPAKPVVTAPATTPAVAEAAAAAPAASAAAAVAPSAASRKKGPGGRYYVTRMRAAELAAKAKAKTTAEPTPNIKPEADPAPANDAVAQPTLGGAEEQESKVTVPDVSRVAARPAVPQQPRRCHVPYAAAPLHEGPGDAAAAETLVVFPLPGWPVYARCQPAQQRVQSPVSAGERGLMLPGGSVSMISDALPVDVADAVADVQPWIHDAFTSQWPEHPQFYDDGSFEDLPFQQQYHAPLPEHHHDVAVAVPLQPPNPRPAADDGNGDGDGAAAPAPAAPAASRQAQGRRGRKRENLNVSVESTASSTASTGSSARRTIVTLALVELLHHKRTCVVPPRLAAAAAMPDAYGEVPLFGDSETPTPVVGRIARVWKTARSDASAQGHIPLVRVLPAREGSAVFQELRRNDAHGLAAARRALAQMATMTPELRPVRILSVEFAVGSEHAVCAAFGHPGSFQSQRLATRLGNTLHTALRLVWVDSDGSPFSHCDAIRPSAPDPSMPRIPVGGRVKSATSSKAAKNKK